MKKLFSSLAALAVLLAFAPQASAQIQTPASSPAAKVKQTVGLTEVAIVYSSPAVNDREIFGKDGLVPTGKPWRFGANAATKFSFDNVAVVAGVEMPAGDYAVLCTPISEAEWVLMFYPYESGNWSSYLEKDPAGKISVKVKKMSEPVERLRFTIEDMTMDAANIVFAWDRAMVKLPISVATDRQVQASIDKAMAGPGANEYFAAASYYHDSGKDLNQALEWVEKATAGDNPMFWQVRRKALILADLGKKTEAIKAAKMSMELAQKAGNDDYVRMNEKSIKEWSK